MWCVYCVELCGVKLPHPDTPHPLNQHLSGFLPLPPFFSDSTQSFSCHASLRMTFSLQRYLCHAGGGVRADVFSEALTLRLSKSIRHHNHVLVRSNSWYPIDAYGDRYAESSHETEVTVARGLRDGGKENVWTVNYMVEPHIPSEASTRDGCHISPIWLINLLTHINEIHRSTPVSIRSIWCCILAVLFDIVDEHKLYWCCYSSNMLRDVNVIQSSKTFS